jgi:hypothetical protein
MVPPPKRACLDFPDLFGAVPQNICSFAAELCNDVSLHISEKSHIFSTDAILMADLLIPAFEPKSEHTFSRASLSLAASTTFSNGLQSFPLPAFPVTKNFAMIPPD